MKALQVPTHTPVVSFISLYVFRYLFHIYSSGFYVLFAKCCEKKKQTNKQNKTRKWLVKQKEWPACWRSPLPQKLGCLLFVLRIYCWFAFTFWGGYCSMCFQSFESTTSFGERTRLQHPPQKYKNRIGRNRGYRVWWCRRLSPKQKRLGPHHRRKYSSSPGCSNVR